MILKKLENKPPEKLIAKITQENNTQEQKKRHSQIRVSNYTEENSEELDTLYCCERMKIVSTIKNCQNKTISSMLLSVYIVH